MCFYRLVCHQTICSLLDMIKNCCRHLTWQLREIFENRIFISIFNLRWSWPENNICEVAVHLVLYQPLHKGRGSPELWHAGEICQIWWICQNMIQCSEGFLLQQSFQSSVALHWGHNISEQVEVAITFLLISKVFIKRRRKRERKSRVHQFFNNHTAW